MQFHRLSSNRLGIKILGGTVLALGALTASVMPALASPNSNLAVTSDFIAYSGQGFTGNHVDIDTCGGHNMPFALGSYQWLNRGQSALLYNTTDEQGTPVTTLPADHAEQMATPVGWKSIFIVC